MHLVTGDETRLFRQKRTTLNKAAAISMFVLGLAFVIISAFYVSSFLVILGVALLFWGAVLLYITPTRHVPIAMLYAEAEVNASNIERIINESGVSLNGIYLPPRNLKNVDSSLVVIPKESKITLPSPGEMTDSLVTNRKDGVLIVPPGAALCRLFEQGLRVSFARLDLKQLQVKLPNLLVEDMELAESAEINVRGNVVVVEVRGSVFDEVCGQMANQPRTHELVGCLLSSAIACALAKTVGEPVIIQQEIRILETETTKITYQFRAPQRSSVPVKSSMKTGLIVASQKIALPRVSHETSSSFASSLDLLKPVSNYLAALLVVGLVVSFSVWFIGWRLYDALEVWQVLPNFDFQNLLLLGMAMASVWILFAGRFISKLAGNEAFKRFSFFGVIAGLDVAVWAIGWFLYGRLNLTLNNIIYAILILLVMAMVSIALYPTKKKLISIEASQSSHSQAGAPSASPKRKEFNLKEE